MDKNKGRTGENEAYEGSCTKGMVARPFNAL
jgi:hypothetical protein